MHPSRILADAQAGASALPVCDHYCGLPRRMQKSLQLQAQMTAELGTCVFDVTLDCEDGAPVGGEAEHAALVAELAQQAPAQARVAVRVHPVDHPHFEADIDLIVTRAGARLRHVMLPKVGTTADIDRAAAALDAAGAPLLPLHALIESPAAVHRAFDIAAHPRVQSLSFGLMDFVSAHAGALPEQALTTAGQFRHPHVLRAKLQIAAACHAHGKVPSHSVVTELNNPQALRAAVHQAAHDLGYTRMWSIHPDQIPVIVAAFAPSENQLHQAAAIIERASAVQWAPIQFEGRLHDRASYRYYWHIICQAHRTGVLLPPSVQGYFSPPDASAAPSTPLAPSLSS